MCICCEIGYQFPLSSGAFAVAGNANVNVIYAYVTTTSTDIICIHTIIDITHIKICINITDFSSIKTGPSRWNRLFRCFTENDIYFFVLYLNSAGVAI